MVNPKTARTIIGDRVAAALAALCMLDIAGCAAVGPDYKPPATSLSSAYRNEAALQARKATLPAPPLDTWWSGFADPALSRIIERVLAQNLDLAAAMARVEQARAAAREAGARQLPVGEASAQAARQHQSLESPQGRIASAFPGYERNQSLYDVGVGASWELDLAGGLRRGAEAAGAEAQAAEAEQLGTRISAAAEAADAYFRVRGAQQRLSLAQAQIQADGQLLDLVRLRLENGMATAREQAQAQARLAQARATPPPLTHSFQAAGDRALRIAEVFAFHTGLLLCL